MRATTIYDTIIDPDGNERKVLNQPETIAAREKQNQIKELFVNWIYEKPERREELEATYKISEILDYLDGQPLRIRGRQFNRVACYDTVYIVSNIPLNEQYKKIQENEPKSWAAFLRRITAVYNFDISKETPVNKFTGELRKPPTLIEIADDGECPF